MPPLSWSFPIIHQQSPPPMTISMDSTWLSALPTTIHTYLTLLSALNGGSRSFTWKWWPSAGKGWWIYGKFKPVNGLKLKLTTWSPGKRTVRDRQEELVLWSEADWIDWILESIKSEDSDGCLWRCFLLLFRLLASCDLCSRVLLVPCKVKVALYFL